MTKQYGRLAIAVATAACLTTIHTASAASPTGNWNRSNGAIIKVFN